MGSVQIEMEIQGDLSLEFISKSFFHRLQRKQCLNSIDINH